MAAITRAAVLLVLVLAGCAAPAAPPPAREGIRLTASGTSGSARVGSFLAAPGELWIGGRCSGGDLAVHVDPVAVLPIPCQALAGGPFLNQVVMIRSTTVTVSVTAAATVTWDLQVRQAASG